MQEYEYDKKIMGCEAHLSLIAAERPDQVAARLMDIAEQAETKFSRFRPESELSRLNRERTLRVSSEFLEVFLLGRDLYRRSSGAFNPLVDISRFGYDATFTEVKGTDRRGASDDLPYDIDLESTEVDESRMGITLKEGQRLDFGGFLKGHVAEQMAKAATDCGGVIVNLGGDVFTRGTDAGGNPFIFEIEHPHGSKVLFFALNAGIATSGSYNRHWRYRGTPFFHVLDRSGNHNPDAGILSATVFAPSGAEADAFATAALVLGEAATTLLANLGFEYCLIRDDGNIIMSDAFPRTQTPAYA